MKNVPLEDDARSVRESLQGHRLEALATLALLTGMRRDELLHLTWAEVDLEQGVVVPVWMPQ
jgi:integrase